MEKENTNPIVDSKAVASKRSASVLDAIPAMDDAAGHGQIPPEWDPYEEVPYIRPPNPYNTCIADPWTKVDSSDIGSDDEDRHTKACQVLQRMQTIQYASYFGNYVYTCPFCKRRLAVTDFNCLRTHVEDISSCNPKVGETVNVNAFRAMHKTVGIHLRNIQRVAIADGRMASIKPKVPKIKGQGSKKWRERQGLE